MDSGADFSLVSGLAGVILGFSRGAGESIRRIKGISGTIPVLMRRVAMKIGPYEFGADVGWAQGDDVPLILVVRHTWFCGSCRCAATHRREVGSPLGRRDVFDHFDVKIRQRESITDFRWRG